MSHGHNSLNEMPSGFPNWAITIAGSLFVAVFFLFAGISWRGPGHCKEACATECHGGHGAAHGKKDACCAGDAKAHGDHKCDEKCMKDGKCMHTAEGNHKCDEKCMKDGKCTHHHGEAAACSHKCDETCMKDGKCTHKCDESCKKEAAASGEAGTEKKKEEAHH
ncbi:MAG: hypothetical protein FD123_3232 [Bacteroidetes bacterium]|nr:MAG: hypothetical protein FD123_3232 [Bacteroidota bacterium]